MYFAVPESSQVTSGLVGSSTTPSSASGSLQSSSSNCAWTSGVIHARSVASVGVAPDAVGLGLGDGLAEPLGDGVGAVRAPGTALLLVGEALLATVGVALADGDGGAVPLGEALGSGTGTPDATASTGRNCSCEDLLIASRTSCVGISGMLTTMLRSPWVVTSAPETPPASTRWTMMSRAWFSCSAETVWPASVRGSRMIWVPPSRSRPSLGVVCASDQ